MTSTVTTAAAKRAMRRPAGKAPSFPPTRRGAGADAGAPSCSC